MSAFSCEVNVLFLAHSCHWKNSSLCCQRKWHPCFLAGSSKLLEASPNSLPQWRTALWISSTSSSLSSQRKFSGFTGLLWLGQVLQVDLPISRLMVSYKSPNRSKTLNSQSWGLCRVCIFPGIGNIGGHLRILPTIEAFVTFTFSFTDFFYLLPSYPSLFLLLLFPKRNSEKLKLSQNQFTCNKIYIKDVFSRPCKHISSLDAIHHSHCKCSFN